jgi:hypothetical protein
MFQTNYVQKIKTYILCSILFSEIPAIYQVIIVEPEMPQMAIRCMCFASWIAKDKNTQ